MTSEKFDLCELPIFCAACHEAGDTMHFLIKTIHEGPRRVAVVAECAKCGSRIIFEPRDFSMRFEAPAGTYDQL